MFHLFPHIGSSSSDEALMIAVSKGNRKAFELLYDRYFQKLVYFGKGLLYGDEALAEDMVQEAFLKIIRQPDSFDTTKKFSTWIYTVVRNQCFNHVRNELNRQRLLSRNYFVETVFNTHANVDAKMLQQKMAALFETFNEKEKTIFILRFQQELSIKEIAAIAEIPEGSVKSGIYYLLKKLSLHLKDYIHAN